MADHDPNNEPSTPDDKHRPLGERSDFRANTERRSTDQLEPQQRQSENHHEPTHHHEPEPESNYESTDNAAVHQHRTGSGMYWAAAIISLALLTLFFNNRLEQQQRDQGITEKLLQQRDGHYYARGEINGQPVVFMLDTGASVVSIPAKMADDMNLPRYEPEKASTANGTVTVFRTKPITVRLGDIVLHDVEAHINPGMEPPAVLLGMSFLGRLDFRQSESRLILKTRPEL